MQQLHLDPGLAGNFVSMHCLTIALFSPPLGILADRVGRLRVLVYSLILYAVFDTAGALMQSFWPLLVTRGLLGAASGCYSSPLAVRASAGKEWHGRSLLCGIWYYSCGINPVIYS